MAQSNQFDQPIVALQTHGQPTHFSFPTLYFIAIDAIADVIVFVFRWNSTKLQLHTPSTRDSSDTKSETPVKNVSLLLTLTVIYPLL